LSKLTFPDLERGFKDTEEMVLKLSSLRIEFEFESRNFKKHKHRRDKCDVIVCWKIGASGDRKRNRRLPKSPKLKNRENRQRHGEKISEPKIAGEGACGLLSI